jgi:hypothetical protein
LPAPRITTFTTSPSIGGCTGQNAKPLGKGDKFHKRLHLHFFHHSVAMGLDRAFGAAQHAGGLFVGVAANDMVENLPLARRQRCDMGANDVQCRLLGIRRVMKCNGLLDCPKKVV